MRMEKQAEKEKQSNSYNDFYWLAVEENNYWCMLESLDFGPLSFQFPYLRNETMRMGKENSCENINNLGRRPWMTLESLEWGSAVYKQRRDKKRQKRFFFCKKTLEFAETIAIKIREIVKILGLDKLHNLLIRPPGLLRNKLKCGYKYRRKYEFYPHLAFLPECLPCCVRK